MTAFRSCAYCGRPCQGWTCRRCADLPALDIVDVLTAESPAMPTVLVRVEAVPPLKGKGA